MMNPMNRLILAALLALFGTMPLMALPQVGEVAPDFTLQTLDGETQYQLSELKGQVVYLDFWASWCKPCRRAFPEVMKLHDEFAEQGLEVLAISLDKAPGPARQFIDKQGSTFPALFDGSYAAARKYGVRSIPSTVIVGPDGKVAFSMIGFDPRRVPEITEIIETLLADVEPPTPAISAKQM